ncbi:MAG: hypothetical protein K1000chlam2_00579 [Chlamydiae bacterium]|nr:hypothetical protein [Chlamydiota bacterium]
MEKGEKRKPLLLKGARQVGKTYSIRQLGKQFESLVEVNFELVPEAANIFEKDLQPERILWELGSNDFQSASLPIEVKSGHGSTLRSMHQFLEKHEKSNWGLRFWSGNYEKTDSIDSRPLYAVATLAHPDQIKPIQNLL